METTIIGWQNELYKDLGFTSDIFNHIRLLFEDLAQQMETNSDPVKYTIDNRGITNMDPKGAFTTKIYSHILGTSDLKTLSINMEEKRWRNSNRYHVQLQFIVDLDKDQKEEALGSIKFLCEELDRDFNEINKEYEYERDLAEFKDRQSDYYM